MFEYSYDEFLIAAGKQLFAKASKQTNKNKLNEKETKTDKEPTKCYELKFSSSITKHIYI